MWLVSRLRLVFSIVLIALLTSLFLLAQMCLLESSCYSGLSQMADSHRRTLYNISQFLYLGPGVQRDMERLANNTVGSVENTLDRNNTSTISSHDLLSAAVSQNRRQNTSVFGSVAVRENPSSQKALEHSVQKPTPAVKYRVVSKLSYAMMQLFKAQSCTEPHCMDYLSSFDKTCYDYCTQKPKRSGDKRALELGLSGECRFMRGEGRAPVALVSLPGSGNTWVRGLLEKATGICTGSVYCDVNLRQAGFNGEEIRSGSVLVVKTHKTKFNWTSMTAPQYNSKGDPSFGAVILLLRNPYKAVVAEWNRKEAQRLSKAANTHLGVNLSHTGSVGLYHFGTNPSWNEFIGIKIPRWVSYVSNMILESPADQPKMVVRYEDMQRDRVREVSRILDFIYYPYSHDTLTERVKDDFDVFHRKRHEEFEAFTENQIQYIEKQLRKIVERLSAENNGDTYRIEEYLRNPL